MLKRCTYCSNNIILLAFERTNEKWHLSLVPRINYSVIPLSNSCSELHRQFGFQLQNGDIDKPLVSTFCRWSKEKKSTGEAGLQLFTECVFCSSWVRAQKGKLGGLVLLSLIRLYRNGLQDVVPFRKLRRRIVHHHGL